MPGTSKKQENMTHNKVNSQSTESELELTQMTELTVKDTKSIIVTIFICSRN